MIRLVALLVLILAALLPRARAQAGPDDQYVVIYSLMQQADSLDNSGQSRQALAQYVQLQDELRKFKEIYPDWNPRIVNFRLKYLEEKITEVTAKLPAAPPGGTPSPRRRRRARLRRTPPPNWRRNSAPCMIKCKNCRRTTQRCKPSSMKRWQRNRRPLTRANWPRRRQKSGR